MQGVVQLFEPQHIASPDDAQQFLVGQPQHLVRCEQFPPALPFGLAVLSDELGYLNLLFG